MGMKNKQRRKEKRKGRKPKQEYAISDSRFVERAVNFRSELRNRITSEEMRHLRTNLSRFSGTRLPPNERDALLDAIREDVDPRPTHGELLTWFGHIIEKMVVKPPGWGTAPTDDTVHRLSTYLMLLTNAKGILW